MSHTYVIPRAYTYARHPRSHAARSSSWPAHERPVLLDERRDCAARTRHPPARALVQSATSAVAGVSEMESSDGIASTDERRRRPDGLRDSKSRLCRRTYWRSEPSSLPARARNARDERWWGDHPGGRNPAEGRTGRANELRAARTEGADELEHGAQGVAQQQQRGGQPFGNQKPSQPPDDVKQEREAVDGPGQRQLGLRRPDREA